jgi:hypothetical protein
VWLDQRNISEVGREPTNKGRGAKVLQGSTWYNDARGERCDAKKTETDPIASYQGLRVCGKVLKVNQVARSFVFQT